MDNKLHIQLNKRSNNAPLVSVAVSVYNVAPFIERCARSLFSQTLTNMEILFIDDCSQDDSIGIVMTILQDYPERESQVRIFHMPSNCGLAAVRRLGLHEAKGEYLIHCDGDDWVDPTLYETMYNKAISSGADVVVCPIQDEYVDYGVARPFISLPTTCKEVAQNWWQECVSMYCWNKLVRRSIYTDNGLVPFEGVNWWEDNGMMFRVFYYSESLSQIEGPVYHYNRANSGAMTKGYGREAVNQMIKCATLLSDFYSNKTDCEHYHKTILTLKYLAKLNLVTIRYDWLKEFNHLFPESNVAIKWINYDAFSCKGKIRFLFVKYRLAWLFVTLYKVRIWASKCISR